MTKITDPANKPTSFRKTEIAADSVCSLLASAALSLVVLSQLGHRVDLWLCMLLAAISLFFVLVFSRKWFLFPIFLGVTGVLFVMTCLTFDPDGSIPDYVGGFFRWILDRFPDRLPYSNNGSIYIALFGLVLPTTALIYLYFRKLFVFYLQPACFIPLLVMLFTLDSPHLSVVLYLLIAVMIGSLAKHAGRGLRRRRADGVQLSEGLMQIPALVLAMLVLSAALLLTPPDGSWKSESLQHLVSDLTDFLAINKKGGAPALASMDTDFMQTVCPLGGDIHPDDGVVLQIVTDTPVLLRGNVYDLYNGVSWQDTENLGEFRFYSALTQAKQREACTLDKPLGGTEAATLFESMSKTVEAVILPSSDSKTLFGFGGILAVTYRNGDWVDAYYTPDSELYFTGPWPANTAYVVTARVLDRGAPLFDSRLLKLEALANQEHDPSFDALGDLYSELPDTLPHSVYILADKTTADIQSPYLKALALEQWLSRNCFYTRTPGSVPEGRDFVDYFLETRQGYCTYFASAMTILARCAGLPARFCVGYAMKPAEAENPDTYLATHQTAHAWTEIYFSGIGWVTFDPTVEPMNYSISQSTQSDISPPPIFAPDPTPEPPSETAAPPTTTPESNPVPPLPQSRTAFRNFLREYMLPLMIVGCLLLFSALFLLFKYSGTKNYYNRLCRRTKDRGKRLNAAYRKLLSEFGSIGLKLNACDTISTFSKRVDAYMGENTMSRLSESVIRYRFALTCVTDREIRALCAYYVSLHRKIRKEIGLFRYLYRKHVCSNDNRVKKR
jgi:hypothetical protein